MKVKSVLAVDINCPDLKLLKAVGDAVLASVAIISMYSLEFLPAPYNTVAFGGGAGLLTATVLATKGKGKSMPTGTMSDLPGMPDEAQGTLQKAHRRLGRAKGKSLERERLMRKYDRVFTEMLSRHGPGSRTGTLERLQPIIYELSPELKAWTGDVRLRVYLLMQELAKDLDNPTTASQSLGLVVLILSKGGKSAVEMARPILGEKIRKMYADPSFDKERFLPRLLLALEDYDPRLVESLMKDAIHVWGDERFGAAWEYLGLEELKERGLRPTIKGLLGGEIARAGNERNTTALNRAVELYHEVK
jgi:hypothetical protein